MNEKRKLRRVVSVMGVVGGLALAGLEALSAVWLDEVPRGFIANAYGPPRSNRSYGRNPLSIAGRSFERGLGTHAPSRLDLNLAGRASRFRAWVGVDGEIVARHSPEAVKTEMRGVASYVYDGNGDLLDRRQGGTVGFRVLADDREIYSSGAMTELSEARALELDLRGVQRLTLVVEAGPDGSYADHGDWAEAQLDVVESANLADLTLTAVPEGVFVSHVGFLPTASKRFLVGAAEAGPFEVVSSASGAPVMEGTTVPRSGDWGMMFEGDFSAVTNEGTYFIRAADRVSGLFAVRRDLDRYCLDKHLNWFLWQRCGDPGHGWERGQHADDGRRLDTGEHQDVHGGWHDAADLRKWCMTVTGLWALAEWGRTLEEGLLRRQVLDEMRWGNTYFLAMQEPDGYLMSHVGGDVERHGDNNRFTDNIVGTPDDRVIATAPAASDIQTVFILAELTTAAAFQAADPAYAQQCLAAADRAFTWLAPRVSPTDAYVVGGMLAAASRMFDLSHEGRHRGEANRFLTMLLELQDTGSGPVTGFFTSGAVRSPAENGAGNETGTGGIPEIRPAPAHNLPMGNLPLWGLCLFCEAFAGVPESESALAALRRYVDGLIRPLEARSTFGQLPYSLYLEDPGGNRRLGDYFYRWGYENREDDAWWNGVNPHLASTGAALVRASVLLQRPDLRAIAQRQLDFIYGANPFNASTAEGLGYGQPDFFKTTEFVPHTPRISGAIMAGLGTSNDDLPVLLPGWWQTTEYWMESVAHTLILLHELGRP